MNGRSNEGGWNSSRPPAPPPPPPPPPPLIQSPAPPPPPLGRTNFDRQHYIATGLSIPQTIPLSSSPADQTQSSDRVDDDLNFWTYEAIEAVRNELGSSQWLSSLSNCAEQVILISHNFLILYLSIHPIVSFALYYSSYQDEKFVFSDPLTSIEQFVFRGELKTDDQEIQYAIFPEISEQSFDHYLKGVRPVSLFTSTTS